MPALILKSRSFLLLAALALVAACSGSGDDQNVATKSADAESPMDSLVSVEWLQEHLDDPDLVILDCSVLIEMDESGNIQMVNGRVHYEQEHIPGAGFADLMGNLSDLDSELETVMPPPEQFVAAMAALGVGDNSRVVLYDANMSVWAARVWWMLRWIGFDNAAVLDGGLGAWKAAGGELSSEPVGRPAKTLSLNLRPELIADRDEVFAAIGNKDVRVIDAMSEPHYRGDFAMYARPGHIPGAINMPTTDLLDETGRYRSHDELDMLMEGARDARTITYCGGGIAASANAFVLHRLGYDNVAVYAGSLQEWAPDPANPMVTGSGEAAPDN